MKRYLSLGVLLIVMSCETEKKDALWSQRSEAKNLMVVIEDYRATHGKFPSKLEDIDFSKFGFRNFHGEGWTYYQPVSGTQGLENSRILQKPVDDDYFIIVFGDWRTVLGRSLNPRANQ